MTNLVFKAMKQGQNKGGSHSTHLLRANRKLRMAKEVNRELDDYVKSEIRTIKEPE